MEIVVRVALLYALEKVYNDITIIPECDPNCCSTTTTTMANSSVPDEPDFGLTCKSYPKSAKANVFHIFIVSIGMIFAVTPRQAMLRTIMWVSPLMLMFGIMDYLYDCTVVLNNNSLTMLRLTTYAIACCWIYQQIKLQHRLTKNEFKVFKWFIPLILWFWSLNYFYKHNVPLSSYSLIAIHITTLVILSYSNYVINQRDMPIEISKLANLCLLLTFNLENADFQYIKYQQVIWLMLKLLPKSATDFWKRDSLILFICFIIELLFLSCEWGFQNLADEKYLKEIYYLKSVTIARVLIAGLFLNFFNKLIFETVQYKFFPALNFDLEAVSLFSMVKKEFFAIDSIFLNLNTENQWTLLHMCFLINFVEILSNFSELTYFVLIKKDKKFLTYTLIISLSTYSSAVFMLGYSLCTFTFSIHLFIIEILAIYVIVLNILSFSRYAVIEIEPYSKSGEMLYWVRHIEFFMFLIRSGLYFSLSISWYLIAISKRGVALLIYRNWLNFTNKAIHFINTNKLFFMRFVKARIFIYFISESKPEVLKKLNDVCSICHEKMLSACVTPCNHNYHKRCLFSCLYIVNKCPLCQCELYTI